MTPRCTSFVIFAALAGTGCDSSNDARLQAAERDFHARLKSQEDAVQWKLDDAIAVQIFDARRDLVFRKCHEEPPTHDANKKACAALQDRVAKREATLHAQAVAEKAAW